MSSSWMTIAGAATVSYLLRFLPFALSRNLRPLPIAAVGALDSMSYAIIGGLVAESLLAGEDLHTRVLFAAAAFLTAAWIKRPSLVFYLFIILFGFYL